MKTVRNIVIIVIVVALLIFSVLTPYNLVKTKQSNISDSLKLLNAQIEQRAELLDGLSAYLDPQLEIEQEIKGIISDINNQTRSASTISEKADANKEVSSVVNGIINYSNSNTDKRRKDFVDELVKLRDMQVRVNTAKNDYNTLIDSYISETQRFPLNVVVKFVKTDDFEYFMTAEELQEHNKR